MLDDKKNITLKYGMSYKKIWNLKKNNLAFQKAFQKAFENM